MNTQKPSDMIRAKFREIVRHDASQMGPDGLLLAGMAVLLSTQFSPASRSRDVSKFHEKFFIHYYGEPRHLTGALEKFRNKRLEEELLEYYGAKTLAEKLDALIDLMYIIEGCLHLHGFTPDMIDDAWKRIHAANMKKELSSSENPGKYGFLGDKRDIVKPPGWEHPDLTDLAPEPPASNTNSDVDSDPKPESEIL